jgi:acyl dehydratase
MPGVLIMEALAQACGILRLESERVVPERGSRVYLVGIDKGRFRKPVLVGDRIWYGAVICVAAICPRLLGESVTLRRSGVQLRTTAVARSSTFATDSLLPPRIGQPLFRERRDFRGTWSSC